MAQGYLNLVLHAHLPFVRHPEHADFLEEDWLFEAISETYIPLIDMMNRLVADGVPFRLPMTLSPTLAEMLVDPLLQERYLAHIGRLVELAGREAERHRGAPGLEESARMYLDHFTKARDIFEQVYRRDLVQAFRRLQEAGVLEVITCPATHAVLPLVAHSKARQAQVRVAVQNYEKHFGRRPRGLWLAECAYQPGDDALLAAEGLGYFFVDTHAILFGQPRPWHGIFAPVVCPSEVAAFPRDPEASEEVWSARHGYPGDYFYREFYRDLGFDADYAYIRPYLHADGVRRNIGLKYHRITGPVDLGGKEPYLPALGLEKAAAHAGDFIHKRVQQVFRLREVLGREPLVTVPFDAELFGHWWFEGPMFLEYLIRKLAYDQEVIRLVTAPEYLAENPALQRQQPTLSSWGAEGYHMIWLNGKNDWLYRHLHLAEERMVELARRFPAADGLTRRCLNQAARELLLAQSSDWPFIITTGTTVPYAVKRFKEHVLRFTRLYAGLMAGQPDEAALADMEWRDSIFQEIDYRVYQ